MQLLIFYFFGLLAVAAAVSMVISRRPIISALFLILNMLCLAGLYALLEAHLIAALQVVVYAGAIMVLVLFVIMLLNMREKKGIISTHAVLKQLAGIGIISFVLVSVLVRIDLKSLPVIGEITEEFGTVAGVGRVLFTDYLLPFEIASVMLLAAIVGAVILSKRKI